MISDKNKKEIKKFIENIIYSDGLFNIPNTLILRFKCESYLSFTSKRRGFVVNKFVFFNEKKPDIKYLKKYLRFKIIKEIVKFYSKNNDKLDGTDEQFNRCILRHYKEEE